MTMTTSARVLALALALGALAGNAILTSFTSLFP